MSYRTSNLFDTAAPEHVAGPIQCSISKTESMVGIECDKSGCLCLTMFAIDLRSLPPRPEEGTTTRLQSKTTSNAPAPRQRILSSPCRTEGRTHGAPRRDMRSNCLRDASASSCDWSRLSSPLPLQEYLQIGAFKQDPQAAMSNTRLGVSTIIGQKIVDVVEPGVRTRQLSFVIFDA
jgi:hypothetical protein